MTTIVKRITKGSTLTVAELDANVANLNNTKLEVAGGTLTGLPVLANQDVDIISPVYPTTKPSLNLDFTRGQLDPRVTFARNSTAAYYDGKSVAKAEENLLTWSQDFRNTAAAGSARPWGNSGAVVTINDAIAPDGTLTANKIVCSTGSVYQIKTGMTSTVAGSIWIKGTAASVVNIGDGYTVNNRTLTGGWDYFTFTSNNVSPYMYINPSSPIDQTIWLWGAQLEQRSSVTAYTPTTTAPITNYIPVLKFAPANVPRFDYDPITGKPLGLLIEEGRTNSASWSNGWGSAHNYVGTILTPTENIAIAPDGTQTAALIQEKAATTVQMIGRYNEALVNFTAGQVYTHSCYVKAGPGAKRYVALRIDSGTAGTSAGAMIVFDLDTLNMVKLVNTNTSGTITAVGNGWYRISITAYCYRTYQPNYTGAIYISNSATSLNGYLGDGYSGFYVWGMQVEYNSSVLVRSSTIGTGSTTTSIVLDASASATDGTYVGNLLNIGGEERLISAYTGSTKTATVSSAFTTAPVLGTTYNIVPGTLVPTGFATSYIPTPSNQSVSRPADKVYLLEPNFSSWYNQNEGTFFIESLAYTLANFALFGIYTSTGIGDIVGTNFRWGGASTIVPDLSIGGTMPKKFAGAYNLTSHYAYLDSTFGTKASSTVVVKGLNIGNATSFFIGQTNFPYNGWIKKFVYYPKALPSTELQALTS